MFRRHLKFEKEAFTLAEVLITLVIIGVIASLVIPTITNTIQKIQYGSAIKKSYSTFSQTYQKLVSENSSISSAISDCGSYDHTCFKDALKKHLQYTKECDSGASRGICFPQNVFYMDGTPVTSDYDFRDNAAGLILNDGTLIDIGLYNPSDCSYTIGDFNDACGWITVDINGFKRPNTFGKDLYTFIFYSNTLKPLGAAGDSYKCEEGGGHGCAGTYLIEG